MRTGWVDRGLAGHCSTDEVAEIIAARCDSKAIHSDSRPTLRETAGSREISKDARARFFFRDSGLEGAGAAISRSR